MFVRLGWKNLPWTNTSLLQKLETYRQKSFITLGTGLIHVGKVRSLPFQWRPQRASYRQAPVARNDQHFCLLLYKIRFSPKMFYNTGPWNTHTKQVSQTADVYCSYFAKSFHPSLIFAGKAGACLSGASCEIPLLTRGMSCVEKCFESIISKPTKLDC